MTDETTFFKKNCGLILDPAGLNQALSGVFPISLNLNHYFSLKLHTMIAYNNV